ncbi:hypothetical protein SEND513_87 [Mycobacterium phage Send513]|uniref:MazG-like nucleotide pyrophosphohydrolase n=1 Tax=Mycobacterium phage Send513 TaxID=1034146 RepID=G1BRR5_9CAUD|nr:MazG-like pyrophosphatase [Mycobacterium phage Send513]AEK07531.1 hypothetical protein SEND513_87 [Mycobacterium phage Send513]
MTENLTSTLEERVAKLEVQTVKLKQFALMLLRYRGVPAEHLTQAWREALYDSSAPVPEKELGLMGDMTIIEGESAPSGFHNLLEATAQFHKLAEVPIDQWIGTESGEGMISYAELQQLRSLRKDLLREEVKEYFDAEDGNDLIEIVDGLLDIIVIAWGTLLSYVGEDRARLAAHEVARSNLSKVDGSLGPIVRRTDGKILKPEGWTGPDILGALQ